MEAPSEHRTARMRHHHDDDTLLFPKRPPDNLSLDVDSSHHARVFSDKVMSGSDSMANRASQNRSKLFVIGGFCCFLFLLATVSIYSSLTERESLEPRTAKDLEAEAEDMPADEIVEEAFSEDEENMDGGHVSEGGDVIDDSELYGDDVLIIIPDIEPVDVEDSVVSETKDLSEISEEGANKDLFIMDINGLRFEIGIGKEGDFDLPDGLILNPHVRQHWALIQNTLGLDDYDGDDEDDKVIKVDEDSKLEPPVPSEEDLTVEVEVAPPVEANAVRMPEGLLFDAPPATGEHVHGEGCDPVSVDVKDTDEELATGDEVAEGEQSAEDLK